MSIRQKIFHRQIFAFYNTNLIMKNIENAKLVLSYIRFIKNASKTIFKRNYYFILANVFLSYIYIKLKKLLNMNLVCCGVASRVMNDFLDKTSKNQDQYIDIYSCALMNVKHINNGQWMYVCSRKSRKRYKIFVIPCDFIIENIICMSDTMFFNISTVFNQTNIVENCFVFPESNNNIDFATEAVIAKILDINKFDYDEIKSALENYFSVPRFLKENDIFCVDIQEFMEQDIQYSKFYSSPLFYFKVLKMTSNNSNVYCQDGLFICYGVTSLVATSCNMSYIPSTYHDKYNKDLKIVIPQSEVKYLYNIVPCHLEEPLKELVSCVAPFCKNRGVTYYQSLTDIFPFFLVKGSKGSGKCTLVKTCSEKLGLHFYSINCYEMQSLTTAQTEAKMKIIFENAQRIRPGILLLANIQVLSKNSEGHKDQRAIATFTTELRTLFTASNQFPIIVVATSEGIDVPAEIDRLFLDVIQIKHPTKSIQSALIAQILNNKNLTHKVNLEDLAELCLDFKLTDINTLISHATKIRYEIMKISKQTNFVLEHNDFIKAYEYMQSVYLNSKNMPRVPKVYWEDIGGLANLKHEIMRRIQLPMLSTFGFKQSGLLLYGPPGTGKTLLAKAVATEYKMHFYSVKGPEVLNQYVGQSEKNVRQIFEQARETSPSIIFFDELDSLAPNRGRSGDSGGVMDRVVSQLLAEMDGLEESGGIFIIGATNRPDLIDPALLRPGRFDKMLYVGMHSNHDSQLNVLKALTRKFNLFEKGEELVKLIDYLPKSVTGADLYAVCSNAWLNAVRRIIKQYENECKSGDNNSDNYSNVVVNLEDFVHAARNLIPSVSDEELKRYENMQKELSFK